MGKFIKKINNCKLVIFATDILWESCFKFDLDQLSYCMSVANITSLAVANVCLATSKIAIFATDMLRKSCSKFNLDQLSLSMYVANIASLAVANFCFEW